MRFNLPCKGTGVWLGTRTGWAGEDDDMKSNTGGEGKQHLQGPAVCEFHRQKLPTMCCCSESLSITANLLVAMLKVIDKSEVFDRTDVALLPSTP